MEKLEKRFRPHVQTWDCYHDVPLEENHAQKCALITDEVSVKFAEWILSNAKKWSDDKWEIVKWHNLSGTHVTSVYFTTKELFHIFLKEGME